VKELRPDAVTIFIAAPSFDELERRLRARATESAGEISERLELARRQTLEKDEFDHVVVNDDLDRAVAELGALVDRVQVGTSAAS
jgi:guanylate kinase